MTVLDRAPVAGDAGGVTGERQERPDPEVPERARRRSFTAQYKLEVLAAYDAAGPGEKGAILRREGLYSSHIMAACSPAWLRLPDPHQVAGNSCHGKPSHERRALPTCRQTMQPHQAGTYRSDRRARTPPQSWACRRPEHNDHSGAA